MNVCVCGLWHLGLVTAACTATAYDTVGFDFDRAAVDAIAGGTLPIFEPGLGDLIVAGVACGRLRWSADANDAVSGADVVWVAWDTPVDENDEGDERFVRDAIGRLIPAMKSGALLLVSSQVPVGFCRAVARECAALGRTDVAIAYSPENLRLGTAIDAFMHPARVVIGVRDAGERRAAQLFAPFCSEVLAMSLESAEMSKHALNAFLATSLSFTNEIAALCEATGADMRDVALSLRSDARIGPGAYLTAGPGFAGGTLARDVASLERVAERDGVTVPLLGAIRASNARNKSWAMRKLRDLALLPEGVVAVLGLTYKPHTDTLRRSSAVELALALSQQGARVQAYDPALHTLPEELRASIDLRSSAGEALRGADVAVIATAWPEFSSLTADAFVAPMRAAVVLDARRILADGVAADPRIRYHAIGLSAPRA